LLVKKLKATSKLNREGKAKFLSEYIQSKPNWIAKQSAILTPLQNNQENRAITGPNIFPADFTVVHNPSIVLNTTPHIHQQFLYQPNIVPGMNDNSSDDTVVFH